MSAVFEFSHLPVLFRQTLEQLAIVPDGCYIDCTLGGGGHSSAILERLGPKGHLYGFDKDTDALAAAGERLAEVQSKGTYHLVHTDFGNIAQAVRDHEIPLANGILADLGVSSWQLDQAERGFSYMQDGPLDMRMNQTYGQTAADLVNTASEAELTRIIQEYGEERYARRISQQIIRSRQEHPIMTTTELAAVIRRAMPAQALREAQHPAKRTFQAIRIAVNGELTALEDLLQAIPAVLAPGGRAAIITFHSLEDRLVKDAFRTWESPCTCPREFPVCICGKKSLGHVITRKPLVADAVEMKENPRARSAKLRVFEKMPVQ
ncbi:MAG: 16S rRNA (cytosine(1402)-N(4))-methyltransferase RsmH [Eubacteriales bacterium]|nr:16S rRNA (cytosine(1402)-N(4))-methyltransferase RsmH [Eubacteriales bacterium]